MASRALELRGALGQLGVVATVERPAVQPRGAVAEPKAAQRGSGTAGAAGSGAAATGGFGGAASGGTAGATTGGAGGASAGMAGAAGTSGSAGAGGGLSWPVTVVAGPGGSVSSTPSGLDCIASSGPCTHSFPDGIQLQLAAVPESGFTFNAWQGDCAGMASPALLLVDAEKSCSASFIELSGEVQLVDPPLSVVPNTTEDPTNILLFLERADFELSADLAFDTHMPGTFTQDPTDLGTLPAGQKVNVYFVHFDPVGTPPVVDRQATIVFPEEILAVITDETRLDASDPQLGLSTIVYPASGAHADRGLEVDGRDVFTIGDDRRSLTLDLETSTSSDQLRVVTLPAGESFPVITSDTARVTPAPAAVTLNSIESNGQMTTFFETPAVVLTSDLNVDISLPGTYTNASLSPGVVPTGTTVTSLFAHFDPTALVTRRGSVTFPQQIRGVIALDANLDASDAVLGVATTSYPTGTEADRGYEFNPDRVRWAGDGRSIRWTARASTGSDQLRVIVQQ